MAPGPYRTHVRDHPGSTKEEIENEPDWSKVHNHRIGYRDRYDRIPGLVHEGDESDESDETENAEFLKKAKQEDDDLKQKLKKHALVNFREAKHKQEDFYLKRPRAHPKGWRYRLNETEDFIKYQQKWPANVKRQKQKEEKEAEEKKEKEEAEQKQEQEHEWKIPDSNRRRHNDAYASQGGQDDSKDSSDADQPKRDSGVDSDQQEQDEKPKSEYEKLREKYSVQEIALLRALKHEKDIIQNLGQSDGKMKSPWANLEPSEVIDDADKGSPDNWIPRSQNLIRLTGKHPLNGEPRLDPLFDAGLITPNRLHYVRNHGAVPHLLWETHKLDVEDGNYVLSMDDLRNNFESVNIAVALACDGNRRKELNMIKRSKGFNWGPGAISNAFWKGPLLADVLTAAGVKIEHARTGHKDRRWVNFEGADEPSEGKYATSIPLEYAMDPTNDVILAYAMNDVPLPPDHGYPVRVIIPGFVGGRNIKWLAKIWVTDKENDSYYHIWDNRVLPSFITEKDGEFAETLFRHPDTACNEQNLNSAIAKPAHGERITLSDVRKGKTYRIAGYAYDGGGHEVQRVEISLDDGKTWLYCIREFPEAPIRHGNKFWTWLHWHIDVELAHLLRAPSITVRCFNVFKNTQPENPVWNVMGMMNNCWYIVRPEIVEDSEDGVPQVLFRHPTEAGTATGGWMQPSPDVRVADAKQSSNTPQKQFTREEIEKHDKEDDCWIVVDGNVYDATSVLDWHPGGKATIMGHAGRLTQETSEAFESIHDGYAYKKLNECVLGTVTDNAKAHMKREAEAAAKAKAEASNKQTDFVLSMQQWYPVTLLKKKELSDDTRSYTFDLGDKTKKLGLGTCQHLQIGFHMADKMLIRSYTPTKPIIGADTEDGTFEVVVKTYFPTEDQPGGALSNILDCMSEGEEVEIRGPTGDIKYTGSGKFEIFKEEKQFNNISLILGGSGLTPGYQLIARILDTASDETKIRVVDANKDENSILLREDLDAFAEKHKDRFEIHHVLSHPSDGWKGEKGHVDEEMIKKFCFPCEKDCGEKNAVFLCGPPAMIQKAAMPALRDWGYEEGKDMFGF